MPGIEIPIVVAESAITENYLGLVNNVLRECGEHTVTSLASPTATTTLAMWYLNVTVEDIYNSADWPFAQENKTYAPVEDQATYDLPSNFDRVKSDPFYTGGQLRLISIDDLDRQVPDKSTAGTPSHYALWKEQLFLYPTPSSDFISDDVVTGTDSNIYVCIKNHTATTDDKPITGANYATKWELDSLAASGGTWASGTDYEDKRIIMRYYRRPIAMAQDGEYPDLPDSFIEVLKIGARAKLKEHLEAQDASLDYGLYERGLRKLMRRRLKSGTYRMRPHR